MKEEQEVNVSVSVKSTKEKAPKVQVSLVEKAFNSVEELVVDFFDAIPKLKFTLEATTLSFDLSDCYPKSTTELRKLKVRANNAPKLNYQITWQTNEAQELEVKLLSVQKNGATEIAKEVVSDAKKVTSALKEMVTVSLKECANRIKEYHHSNAEKIAKILSGDGATLEDLEGVWELPEEVYRLIDGLNNSLLKEMDKSYNHFIESANSDKKTKAMLFGTLSHLNSLEKEKYNEQVVITEVLSKATNEGKKQDLVNSIIHAGRYVVDPKVQANVDKGAEKLKAHPLSSALLANSKYEQVYVWGQDVEVNGTTLTAICKGKADGEIVEPSRELAELICKYLRVYSVEEVMSSVIVWEMKTTNDASDLNFIRTYENFDYDIQGACYSLGARKLYNKPVIFLIVALESSAPFEVNVFPVSPSDIDSAEDVYLNRLARCLRHREDNNLWKGYSLRKDEFLSRRYYAQNKNLDRASRKIDSDEEL